MGKVKNGDTVKVNYTGKLKDGVVFDSSENRDPLNVIVGQRLTVDQGGGATLQVVVTNLTDDAMTIDANHPLAGHDLIFDIELVEIS